jgi:hypothetical protein
MTLLLSVLLLAAAAHAAVDFSKLSSIATTATFHLHVEIDQLFFGSESGTVPFFFFFFFFFFTFFSHHQRKPMRACQTLLR